MNIKKIHDSRPTVRIKGVDGTFETLKELFQRYQTDKNTGNTKELAVIENWCRRHDIALPSSSTIKDSVTTPASKIIDNLDNAYFRFCAAHDAAHNK